jgi:hypothetical protein
MTGMGTSFKGLADFCVGHVSAGQSETALKNMTTRNIGRKALGNLDLLNILSLLTLMKEIVNHGARGCQSLDFKKSAS